MQKTQKIQSNKKWTKREKNESFISDKLSDEIISILASRGVKNEAEAFEFLEPSYQKLPDPYLLKDMDKAVEVIVSAVSRKEKITIYGDYDVDGVSATTLLVSFFEEIGADVEYYIPSRHTEGYGLNLDSIQKLVENGTKLIITVDCGSTSLEEIALAKELGLRVVVTDHHILKQEDGKDLLPDADALVNPKRSTSSYKQELAGVGVAFYLVRALQEKIIDKFPKGQEKWLLDLVALGTICDVVPLLDDNRILASFGLKVLAKSKRPGIRALAQVSEFELKNISSYQVGFLLGPRLNASGRLETAHKAVELLTTKDEKRAIDLANELNLINKSRQEITEKILNEAREAIENINDKRKVYLLAKKDWPAGVVGIVASRLVDEYGKPVLVMEDLGDELKGSARSIKALNMIEALTECRECFSHFGGHAFAAGFSLPKEHFILLENKLIELCENKLKEEDLLGEILIDEEITVENINFHLIEEIRKLEPYGQGNPKPLFVLKNLEISDLRLVGNPAIHLKLTLGTDKGYISGMLFNNGETTNLSVGDHIDLVVTLEENVWRDRRSIEFRALDLRPSE